jgi:hypothetical protein
MLTLQVQPISDGLPAHLPLWPPDWHGRNDSLPKQVSGAHFPINKTDWLKLSVVSPAS